MTPQDVEKLEAMKNLSALTDAVDLLMHKKLSLIHI